MGSSHSSPQSPAYLHRFFSHVKEASFETMTALGPQSTTSHEQKYWDFLLFYLTWLQKPDADVEELYFQRYLYISAIRKEQSISGSKWRMVHAHLYASLRQRFREHQMTRDDISLCSQVLRSLQEDSMPPKLPEDMFRRDDDDEISVSDESETARGRTLMRVSCEMDKVPHNFVAEEASNEVAIVDGDEVMVIKDIRRNGCDGSCYGKPLEDGPRGLVLSEDVEVTALESIVKWKAHGSENEVETRIPNTRWSPRNMGAYHYRKYTTDSLLIETKNMKDALEWRRLRRL